MKFQHVIEAVYFQPWNITVPGWKTIHSIVLPYLRSEKVLEPRAGLLDDDGLDWMQQPLPAMDITRDGVAIIPIKGPLIMHAGLLEKKCGACSYDDIKRDLRSAVDAGLEMVALDINSPGGMCVGNQEVAEYILQLREQGMRIKAFSDSIICSAAYNIAAACEEVFITPTTMAANIGTIMAILDCSEQFKEAGLKVDLFTTGKFKGAGVEGTSLTEEQRAYFQGLSDKYGAMFKDNVRANRLVEEETMEGQVIVGSDAADAGLVDGIVRDLDDVLERFE